MGQGESRFNVSLLDVKLIKHVVSQPFASYPPLSSPAKTSSSSNERLSKPPPALHNRIPFHRLPSNLVVHDPWGIVGAGQDDLTEVVAKGLKEGGLVWPEPPENMVDANGDGRGETVAMRVEDNTKEGKKEKEGGQSKGVKEAAVNRIETMKSEIGEAEDNAMDIDKEEAGEKAAIVEDTMEDTSQMSVDSPCSNSGTEINTKSPRPPTLKDVLHHYKLSLSSAGRAKVEFERAALERTKAEVRELVQTFRSNPRTQTLKPLLDYFDVVDDHSTSEGGMKARRVERISKTQNGVYGTPGMKHWDSAVTQPTGECRVAGYKHARWTRFGILIDPKELYYDAKGKPWVYAMWKMPPWLEGADPRFDGDRDVEEMASEGKENEEKKKTEDETAHLYLSPTAYIGSGNHSLVYSVEWDLPRSTIFDGMLEDWCEPLWKGWENGRSDGKSCGLRSTTIADCQG
ncbi:hypothetical protein BKA70DRAFT_254543 [Coprinopsis sp. MPI-PUGE-AT-0042]|nr:hypothetical protein BKA70DRAFT_254543 [Coprinopsis sp. MPI-PUGE-AT-0042]